MKNTLGLLVRFSRATLGLSQTETARRARISRQTLSSIERDRISWPKREVIRRLSRALEIDEVDMLTLAYRPEDDR